MLPASEHLTDSPTKHLLCLPSNRLSHALLRQITEMRVLVVIRQALGRKSIWVGLERSHAVVELHEKENKPRYVLQKKKVCTSVNSLMTPSSFELVQRWLLGFFPRLAKDELLFY